MTRTCSPGLGGMGRAGRAACPPVGRRRRGGRVLGRWSVARTRRVHAGVEAHGEVPRNHPVLQGVLRGIPPERASCSLAVRPIESVR
jgi:hypothetical protein